MIEVAAICNALHGGKATVASGSPYTTLTDTLRFENVDHYNGGTLFIRSGTYANISKLITAYVKTTGVITFTPATAGSIAINTQYDITNISRDALVHAINFALTYMGEYTDIDESLTVTDNATEYTLPTGVDNIKSIEVYTTSAAPYGFTLCMTWRETHGQIQLPVPLGQAAGNKIRLFYNKFHDPVEADADEINSAYNLKRLAWTGAWAYLVNRTNYTGNVDEKETRLIDSFAMQAQRLAASLPVYHKERDPIFANFD
jgi:hypothetical protein